MNIKKRKYTKRPKPIEPFVEAKPEPKPENVPDTLEANRCECGNLAESGLNQCWSCSHRS